MKKPIYLIAGGNWRKSHTLGPLFGKILSETEKKSPRVAYIGTANGDAPSFFEFFKSFISEQGGSNIDQIFLARERADVDAARSVLAEADAVFMSGGDVDEGIYWLHRHRMAPFLRERYEQGVLFFGLSAGSIMLGERWVRWRDPDDDSTAELFECLRIAPLICDTHAEADDWEELKVAVGLLGSNGIGYGIPTDGVIRVAGDGSLSALNKNVVRYLCRADRVAKTTDLKAAGR
jgi:peptidase E